MLNNIDSQNYSYLDKSRLYKNYHYSVLDSKEIEYLHKRTVEMFKEVVKLFNINNIQYMICGGTLLGAVTTGKFIPWDDDLDVCVMDEDYERAIDILIKGLSPNCVLQCCKTDSNYYLGWVKVRDKKSHVYPDAPAFKENGVWLDIYRLIKTQEKNIPYLIAKESIDYLNRRLAAAGLTKAEYDERINNNQLKIKLEEAKQYAENGSAKEKYLIWSASKIALEKEWIKPLTKVNFEGIEVTTFADPHSYLKQHYGNNYATLPPDEKRRVGINKIEIL